MTDDDTRREALDVTRSFVVQAPAGSGKTSLLVQRLLSLLSVADTPEEIVAMTFTRKATSELRTRVLNALVDAAGPAPDPAARNYPHRQRTWVLAHAALERDRARGWGLIEHPQRLRIYTIDGLCSTLVRAMPVSSGLGPLPVIVQEDSEKWPLYRAAARATLTFFEQDRPQVVARFLGMLGNDRSRAESLIAEMLPLRDQWIGHLLPLLGSQGLEGLRQLEAAITRLIEDRLARTTDMVPVHLQDEIVELARGAAGRLQTAGIGSAILVCSQLTAWPPARATALDAWRGLAELLVTKGDEAGIRKQADKRIGFPQKKEGGSESDKRRMEAVLESLACVPDLAEALGEVCRLPDPVYSARQRRAITFLPELLIRAVQELMLLFQERGVSDHMGIQQAALTALGDDDVPSDLALRMDDRLRHLLVDEFQDTSRAQYDMIRRLTAGWESDDGHSLFVVGDPAQSIYRFRQADVALFLRLRDEGIGNLRPVLLTLSTNFRSSPGLVAWFNAAFEQVFQEREDADSSAIRPVQSEAGPTPPFQDAHGDGEDASVQIHPLVDGNEADEARKVAEIVSAVRKATPEAGVAVLVRARPHLRAILPELRARGIPVSAREIDSLATRPVVQDLLTLTRVCTHPDDRLHALACLRAPFCGLTLADLATVASATCQTEAQGESVVACLRQPEVQARLSPSSCERVLRVAPILAQAQSVTSDIPVSRRVETAWCLLGGSACYADTLAQAHAEQFLDLLASLEQAGGLPDFAMLQTAVTALYAAPDETSGNPVQVMTLHKAKGLEFDHVILPGLGRAPKREDHRLLCWEERIVGRGQARDLLLAPLSESGSDERDARLVAFLRLRDQRQEDHELRRLLYVGATRAKQRLHLVGLARTGVVGKTEARAIRRPGKHTLLDVLWPVIEGDFIRAVPVAAADPLPVTPLASPPPPPAVLRRVRASALPAWTERLPGEADPGEDMIEFSWAGLMIRQVGVVVHRYLQRIACDGPAAWTGERLERERPGFARALADLGVPTVHRETGAARVQDALTRSLNDPRGRWLLGPHRAMQSEYALTGIVGGELVSGRIDLTFVDDDGTRWIVDYKTSAHTGGDVQAFLDQERLRYAPQLERYAALMQLSGNGTMPAQSAPQPVHLGLYYPLLAGWVEWK